MYLKKLYYENIGPLKYVDINMPFNDNDSPKPLIIVGKNGSGKSIFLSNIVDSIHELGGNAYNNVIKMDSINRVFYKVLNDTDISYGESASYSYIQYSDGNELLEFLCTEGKINLTEWKSKSKINCSTLNLDRHKYKSTTNDNEKCKKLFESQVCCYFSADRFSKPVWQSEVYTTGSTTSNSDYEGHVNGELINPIIVESDYKNNITWIIDVLLDASLPVIPISKNGKCNYRISPFADENLTNISLPIKNLIEQVLSKLLEKQVFISYFNRNNGLDRIKLVDKNKNLVLHSLRGLSTGQMALFNIFITILRYMDRYDIDNTLSFNTIKGVVIIDEIDLHLHNDLQYKVLPELLKLFPMIQFVITTHSPLFILGMNKYYGKNQFEIREFPKNEIIQPEEFSEFLNAYDVFENTSKYRQEINMIKIQQGSNPLIITEGPTDWMHMKHALNKLKKDSSLSKEDQTMLLNIDVSFLEFTTSGEKSLQMGDNALIKLLDSFSKIYQNRKFIFISDNDKLETIKKLKGENDSYKDWGNNVYSLCLPNVKSRGFSEICIEHYYHSSDLTKKVKCNDGIFRRIYQSLDFDNNGILYDNSVKTENVNICSKQNHILDGSSGKEVYVNDRSMFDDEQNVLIKNNSNLALSKLDFAKAVCEEQDEFKNIDVKNFIPLFRIIFDVCKLSMK